MKPHQDQGRAGFAAIVGRPNVGKSTLLNRVLGAKIAIVSRRPQTTRNRILGVCTRGSDQLILVDTPGIHRSRANLNRFMVKEALQSLQGIDCVVMMTEVEPTASGTDLCTEDRYVLEQLQTQQVQAPCVLAINKIDRLPDRRALLPLMDAWQRTGMENIVPISALTGDNVDALLEEVVAHLPRGPHLYPEEMITDRAERFLVAELIREQVFARCHKEIPYSTAVEIVEFKQRASRNDVCIEAIIHVERESQRAIMIGKGGTMIKAIGTAVRKEIASLLNCPVHLKLVAHVEPRWSRTPRGRRKLGYE